ncbi:MAG: hypothetical protein M1831_001004 [Alyxoria varia]|nr:MAG: hypothetical protein M1831_001004 [Alyxoria varia]
MATSMDTGQEDALGNDNMEIFEDQNIQDEIMIYDSDDNIDDEMGDKSPNVFDGDVEPQQDEELNDAIEAEDPDLELTEAPDAPLNQDNDQEDDFDIDIGGPSDSIEVPGLDHLDRQTVPANGDSSLSATQDMPTSSDPPTQPQSNGTGLDPVPNSVNQVTAADKAEEHVSLPDEFGREDENEDHENEGNDEHVAEPELDESEQPDTGAGEEDDGHDDAEGSYDPKSDPALQNENVDPGSQISSDSHPNQRRTSNHYDSPEYKNEYADHPITLFYQDNEMCLFHPREGDSMYLLGDPSLVHEPFKDLLAACREKLGGTVDESVELEIEAPSLGLRIGEDSPYASSSTLIDIVEIYVRLSQNDGVEELAPLEVVLKVNKRFFAQFSFLRDAMADGRGLTEITQSGHDDVQQENEYEDVEQYGGESYNDDAGDAYDDNNAAEETAVENNDDPTTNNAGYDEQNGENEVEENCEEDYEDELEEGVEYENNGGGEGAAEAENAHGLEQSFETAPTENDVNEIVDFGDDTGGTADATEDSEYVTADIDAGGQSSTKSGEGENNAGDAIDEDEIDFYLEDDELGVPQQVSTDEAGAVEHGTAADLKHIESQSRGDSDSDATLQATNAANTAGSTAAADDLDEIQLPEEVGLDAEENLFSKSEVRELRGEPFIDMEKESLQTHQGQSKGFEAEDELDLGGSVDYNTDHHTSHYGSKGEEDIQEAHAANETQRPEINKTVQESKKEDKLLVNDELDDEFDIPPSAGLDNKNMYIDPDDQIDWSDDEIDDPAPSNPPLQSSISNGVATAAHNSGGLNSPSRKRSFEDFDNAVEAAANSPSAAKKPRAS